MTKDKSLARAIADLIHGFANENGLRLSRKLNDKEIAQIDELITDHIQDVLDNAWDPCYD